MSNNAKIGGILSIIAGGLGIIGASLTLLFILLLYFSEGAYSSYYYYDYYYYDGTGFVVFFTTVYLIIGIVGLLLGVLALIGGIQALRRRRWGLALAGAIASCLTFFPCGIVAVIFVAMGKPEFVASQQPVTVQ